MNRTAALVVGALAVAAVTAPPALAAPKKKPITKSYDVTAATPDPTNNVPGGYSVCAQNVPGSFDKQTFQVPAAGTLSVELSGFQGDWDLLLEDSDDSELSYSGGSGVGGTEATDVRFKKAQKMSIVACNFAGTPNATVKYTFTYK
jgi:energy-converting hydrogenase Eha subunit A